MFHSVIMSTTVHHYTSHPRLQEERKKNNSIIFTAITVLDPKSWTLRRKERKKPISSHKPLTPCKGRPIDYPLPESGADGSDSRYTDSVTSVAWDDLSIRKQLHLWGFRFSELPDVQARRKELAARHGQLGQGRGPVLIAEHGLYLKKN